VLGPIQQRTRSVQYLNYNVLYLIQFKRYTDESKTITFSETCCTKCLFSISKYFNLSWRYWQLKKPLYVTSVQAAALFPPCSCCWAPRQNPVQSNLALVILTLRCCGGSVKKKTFFVMCGLRYKSAQRWWNFRQKFSFLVLVCSK